MGWNIVMLRQACHFALGKKIKQKKNSRTFNTQAQVTKKLEEIMGKLNLPEFFQNNCRIFQKILGFFCKLKGFSKNSRIFQIYSRISPNTRFTRNFFSEKVRNNK